MIFTSAYLSFSYPKLISDMMYRYGSSIFKYFTR